MYARLTTRGLLFAALFICSEPILAQKKGGDSVGDRLQALEAQVASLQAALAAETSARQNADAMVTNILVHFSRVGNDIYITGANLHVVNGLNATGTTNGLGNVIIGYNEERTNPERPPDDRSGSHMLVVGRENNYSSFGGIVIGHHNDTRGPYSSVKGGYGNTAAGSSSSVSGGSENTATGTASSVAGGLDNTAQGAHSSVAGGVVNTAIGLRSSVSGGSSNTASAAASTVSGGSSNTASANGSSVSGGYLNSASGTWSSVSGGRENTATGSASSVSGGFRRMVTRLYEWIAGTLVQNTLGTNGGL